MANAGPTLILCKDINIILVTYIYIATSVNEKCEQHFRYEQQIVNGAIS